MVEWRGVNAKWHSHTVAEPSDNLRASNADRQVVVDALRKALDEGRLDLSEYDDRIKEAYAAKTYGDLNGLLVDLPVTQVARSQVQPAGATSVKPVMMPTGATAKWIMAMWGSWLTTSLVVVAIWFATALTSDDLPYFWPIWVIGPWGAILLASTIGGLATGEPRGLAQRRARRDWELDRQRRRDRHRGRYRGESG